MFDYNGKTDHDLRRIAQTSALDFLSNGTDPTQAVVKAASAESLQFTDEHIRRICEMSYHDIHTRMFNEKQGSADKNRMIHFDPPNAIIAADLYQKTAASGLPAGQGVVPTYLQKQALDTLTPLRRFGNDSRQRLNKIAEANTEFGGTRFQPMNQFDLMMANREKKANDIPLANPMREPMEIYRDSIAARQDIEGKLASAARHERESMDALVSMSKQLIKEGAATDQLLHIGFSICDMSNNHVSAMAQKVAETLAKVLPHDKLAGVFPEVNRKHPFIPKFAEAVRARSERVHLEFSLDDIRRGESDIKRAILDA